MGFKRSGKESKGLIAEMNAFPMLFQCVCMLFKRSDKDSKGLIAEMHAFQKVW